MNWDLQQGLDNLTLAIVVGLSIIIAVWILHIVVGVASYLKFRIKMNKQIKESYKNRSSRYPSKPIKK